MSLFNSQRVGGHAIFGPQAGVLDAALLLSTVEAADVSAGSATAAGWITLSASDSSDASGAATAALDLAQAACADLPDVSASGAATLVRVDTTNVDFDEPLIAVTTATLNAALVILDADDISIAAGGNVGAAALAVVEAGDIVFGQTLVWAQAVASTEDSPDSVSAAIASSASGTGATAGEIWGFLLPNGLTAAQILELIYGWANDLARIHGLVPGEPLEVGATVRSAGPILQAIAESGGVVTVTRQ